MDPIVERLAQALAVVLGIAIWAVAALVLVRHRRESWTYAPWELWHLALVLVGFVLASGLVQLAMVTGGVEFADISYSARLSASLTIQLLVFVWAIGVLLLDPHIRPSSLGFTLARWPTDLALGLAGLVVALPAVQIVYQVLKQWADPTQLRRNELFNILEDEGQGIVLLQAVVAAVIMAPLVEEFVFRGLLQGYLQKIEARQRWQQIFPGLPAGLMPNIIASVLFAAAHGAVYPDRPALFVLGLMLGWLYWKTGRLWASIFLHLIFNGMMLILFFLTGGG